MWQKGRENKDGQLPDDDLISVGEKLVSLPTKFINMFIYFCGLTYFTYLSGRKKMLTVSNTEP